MSNEQRARPAPPAGEIIETARHLFGLSGSSWDQFRRYAMEHLAWCEAEGIEVPADNDARARYRAHLETVGKVSAPRHWTLRATAINKLPAAIAELHRQVEISAARGRTRLIDALPVGSQLRQTVETVLGEATGAYRSSLRCDVAVVLDWCVANEVDALMLDSPHVSAFEEWLRRSGRRSRGPLFAARRLQRAAHRPIPWWR